VTCIRLEKEYLFLANCQNCYHCKQVPKSFTTIDYEKSRKNKDGKKRCAAGNWFDQYGAEVTHHYRLGAWDRAFYLNMAKDCPNYDPMDVL